MSESNQKASELAAFVEVTAKACHEALKSYKESIGDNSQPSWEDATPAQRESTYSGVIHALTNPKATPEDVHKKWMQDKVRAGWVYGKEKDEEHRMHPMLVPYAQLPEEEKAKDEIFQAVVQMMEATSVNLVNRIRSEGLEVNWNA